MKPDLVLCFPQWQGAGDARPLSQGAEDVLSELPRGAHIRRVEIEPTEGLSVEAGIRNRGAILAQLERARDVLLEETPRRLLTIGGDCGVELAPVSYLNEVHDGRLGVIWIDAHGDLNSPETSPSHNFHGMPLRHLLGEGDPEIVARLFSTLGPEQLFLVGARALDPAEEDLIEWKRIHRSSVAELNGGDWTELEQALAHRGVECLYIHLDLDGLDPEEIPDVWYPTPGGIGLEPAVTFLSQLADRFRIVGWSLTEYVDRGGLESRTAIARILREGFGYVRG